MFKLIGWILKATFFTAVVLVAAHYVTWNGKTVSDQVGSTLSSAEKSAPVKTIHKKSKVILQNAKEAASHVGIDTAKRELTEPKSEPSKNEGIPAEDRARLQALIHSSDNG
jgi:hypothetical protein